MDPWGGDLFVVGSTQQSQQSGKNGQKLAGNQPNLDEPHQTVSHFFVKNGFDSNSGTQGVSVLRYSRTPIISPAIISQTPILSPKGLRRDLYLIKNPKNPDYITHFENEKPRFYHSFFWEK